MNAAPARQIVRVALAERSYDIAIGTGILSEAGGMLTAGRRVTHAAIVTDANLESTHAPTVAESLSRSAIAVDVLVVEAGEPSKSVETADALWRKLLEVGADRKTAIVAVGGGVVGDLAGFVAATYARGLALLQIPTSLLAQVDSSVGGKVGINLPAAKNMVGAFWQPIGVLIDTNVLATLPEREYRAGLAEVIKYGVILDADFFCFLEGHVAELSARQPETLREVIARCCQLKADVVSRDEREETGLRAVLNYGHTFCHAIEAVSGYGEILHGEAVSIGMVCASRLAERLGRIGADITQRQQRLLGALGLPVELPGLDAGVLLDVMSHDKKTQHGRLRFVLPTRLGVVELVEDVPPDQVLAVLKP